MRNRNRTTTTDTESPTEVASTEKRRAAAYAAMGKYDVTEPPRPRDPAPCRSPRTDGPTTPGVAAMPTVEHRTLAVAPTTPVAQPDAQLQEGEFLAKAVVYGVVDTYGTDFAPGVFNQSLSSDPLPPVLWSHNSQQSPTNVLGRLVDWHDSLSALLVVGQLDQANPHYDLMRGQLQSKTICRRVGRLRPPGGPAVRN